MARAYFCIARNDLPSIGDSGEAALQINDLKPRSSDALRNVVGYGQTGAWAYLCDFSAVVAPANLGGIRTTAQAYYNLTGYLMNSIHADPLGANCTLSDADALAIAQGAAVVVAAGTPLTVAAFNAICTAIVGGATGIGVGNSFATLEEILRILSGEIFCLPAGAVSGAGAVGNAGGAFLGALAAPGYFVIEPIHQVDPIRGRSFSTPIGAQPVQVAPHDLRWRNVRVLYNTGDLSRSILNGQLSQVIVDTWAWVNPSFTYGAAGTALDIAGNNLLAGGASRACTVYDASGNVL